MIRRWNSGSSFEAVAGYDRVMRVNDWIFVSGTTGFDYSRMEISDRLEDQVNQTLANVSNALELVGSSPSDVIRIRWIITQRSFFHVAGELIGRFFDPIRPPATTIVADLIDERMLFELEVTALVLQDHRL